MSIDYVKLVAAVSGDIITASDPSDYDTIIWKTKKGMAEYNDNGIEVIVKRLVDVNPIPKSVLLEEHKTHMLDEIGLNIEAAIKAGFISNALGSDHKYETLLENQINIIGAVIAGVDMYYSCIDIATDVKQMRFHTADQIKQVFIDGVSHKQNLLHQYYTRKNTIVNATSQAELEDINLDF